MIPSLLSPTLKALNLDFKHTHIKPKPGTNLKEDIFVPKPARRSSYSILNQIPFCSYTLTQNKPLNFALDYELKPKLFQISHEFKPYVSGNPDHLREFKNPNMQTLFSHLFEQIISHTKYTKTSLSPYDLYHGHLFAIEDKIGVLFHAKEYPKDHPSPGNMPLDVQNSPFSMSDPDFHLRNFLWLSKTNQIYLIDPKHPQFPSTLSSPLNTVDENSLSQHQLGSLNYFDGQLFLSPIFKPSVDLKMNSFETESDRLNYIKNLSFEDSENLSNWLKNQNMPSEKAANAMRLEQFYHQRQQRLASSIDTLIKEGFEREMAEGVLLSLEVGCGGFSVQRAREALIQMEEVF